MASIAAGLGKGNPAYTGVAPGASLVGIKVLNAQGSGTTSGILAGIDWMIQNKGRYNIRVANMSLGASGCSDGLDALSSAVNSAVDQGIIMVVAAGNSGPNRCTIGAPGAAAKAITVGASYDPGERGWALAEFSSRGPTADGRVKPDIVAPGRNITAAKAGTVSGYVTYSGTSMATPFISGVVALMLSANPSLTASQVKSYLLASEAVKHFGASGKNIDYGYGLTVAYHAVRLAGSFTGSFSDGLKYSFAQDSLAGTGQRRDYTFTVAEATYPIGITLIMAQNPSCGGLSCTPDFDLYLYDPSGALVASSTTTKRQEQITYQPTRTGQYTLRVTSYSGSGTYTLDVSWR